MSQNVAGTIDELLARTQTDAELREQMLADPKATIQAETGMTVPADWALLANVNDGGHVVIDFDNGELPDDYLELVSGGYTPDCCV